ncbi:hypothetical protein KP509_1Z137100 [Ceratopteris richardii]|nr:hypothetical protein KP509_1Z137100 [Ceratopteris richardii]KAH6557067.1 hypothetical protein KP509_1Z137100 [Ceratopteris richardii]
MASSRIGVALDFSPGSKYAVEWALKHIVKEGHYLFCVIVSRRTRMEGETHRWGDYGSSLFHLPEFSSDGVLKNHGISPDWSTLCHLERAAHEKQVELLFKIYWGDATERVWNLLKLMMGLLINYLHTHKTNIED